MAKVVSSFWRQNDHPAWAADFFSRDHLVPAGGRLDVSTGFPRSDQVILALDASTAPVTTVPLESAAAKTGKATGEEIIPTGAVLRVEDGLYLKLTAPVVVGDTDITVEETQLDTADTMNATYDGKALLVIPSGTLIGKTFAEDVAGDPFGPADDADDIMFLIAFPVQVEHPFGFGYDSEVDVALYRHNSVVKENFLPGGIAALTATQLAYVRDKYITQQGVA